jgi:ABC-type sulfate transport system permease subunit
MTDALLPLIFLVSALIVDAVALWQLRHGQGLNDSTRGSWLLGIIITLPQLVIAPCLLVHSLNVPLVFLDQPDVTIPADLKLQAALIAVPAILIFGVMGALAGANFGDIWRWNKS